MILAIESSCDETAAAVVLDGKILSNECFSQIKHHKRFGGVMPEVASRLHVEYIDRIIKSALTTAKVELSDITHIAVTVGPGLEGSLLVGMTAANMLALSLNIPIVPINHLHGHVFSVLAEHKMTYPLLACIASGGHTMLIHMTNESNFEIVANTMDDACGESFDKVARMLGLSYPGGPEIEALAKKGVPSVDLPHPVKHKQDSFSFSGLKTAVLRVVDENEAISKQDIAASFQHCIANIFSYKINAALDKHPTKQLVLCGGVFSNQFIRESIVDAIPQIECLIPQSNLCTDNAAMIGLASEVYIKQGRVCSSYDQCQTRLGINFPKLKNVL